MDAGGPNVASFRGGLPELRESKGQCFDPSAAQLPSLLWNQESMMGVQGDQGLQYMAADPSPFSVVDVGAAQQIMAAQTSGCDADQYFSTNFLQMEQAQLPMGSSEGAGRMVGISEPLQRQDSMDFAPIHVKPQAGKQFTEAETMEALGMLNSKLPDTMHRTTGMEAMEVAGALNSTKEVAGPTAQVQGLNPGLQYTPSEGSNGTSRAYYSTSVDSGDGMVTVYLQQGVDNQPNWGSMATPQSQPVLFSCQPGPCVEQKLSSRSSHTVLEGQRTALAPPKPRQGRRGDGGHPRARWKPTPAQLCLLEQHFKSGYTKPTPELVAAVQAVGQSTAAQVSVWLKNRLSRCKNQPTKVPESQGSSSHGDADAQLRSSGAVKHEQEDWHDFHSISTTVIEELNSIASTVSTPDINFLAAAVKDARHICCYGVGREGLVMKALASNLHHMGFVSYFIGDINMPTVGSSDLFLVSAGPSYYSSVSALALEAMRLGGKVVAFTSHKTAELPFAEHVIRIPSQTLPPSMPTGVGKRAPAGSDIVSFLPGGQGSILHMGASYELSLWLVLECVSVMLRKKCKVGFSDMRRRHTNLQ